VLNAKKADTILCTIGFISENKGVDHAVKALSLLPENYKLAIIGGINPDSGRPEVYDAVSDLIIELNLQDRVHITGYIEDDDELSYAIRGCDIALYPYNPDYYKLASSDSINRAIMNNVPVIAYPTESFKEINANTDKAIVLTESPNYYELAREATRLDIEAQIKHGKAFAKKNTFTAGAQQIIDFYKSLLGKA